MFDTVERMMLPSTRRENVPSGAEKSASGTQAFLLMKA